MFPETAPCLKIHATPSGVSYLVAQGLLADRLAAVWADGKLVAVVIWTDGNSVFLHVFVRYPPAVSQRHLG